MKAFKKSNKSILKEGVSCSNSSSQYLISSSNSITPSKPFYKSKHDENSENVFKNPERPYDKISLTIPLKYSKSLEDFEIGPLIGKGKFSEVHIARDKSSNFIVAIKVLKKCLLKKSGLINQMKREIWIQSLCKHTNILQIYGYFFDELNIYLILEYASEGDLYSILKRQFNGRFTEMQAALYIKQVCEALIFLHKRNIIHRDIKPENLMLSLGALKIADFGLAIEIEEKDEKRQTFCGTMDYMSPEMFSRLGHDFSVDVWSVGVLCYELCCGKAPFESNSAKQTMKKVCDVQFSLPDFFSADLKELIYRLFVVDPKKRFSLEEILNSNWMKYHLNI